MKINRIIAKGISGIYKEKDIEVEIKENSEDCKILVNGKEIKDVFGIHIHLRAGKMTTLVIEKYAKPKDLE